MILATFCIRAGLIIMLFLTRRFFADKECQVKSDVVANVFKKFDVRDVVSEHIKNLDGEEMRFLIDRMKGSERGGPNQTMIDLLWNIHYAR